MSSEAVDHYIQSLPKNQQQALAQLRIYIQSCAPDATLGISYQVPTFTLYGRMLLSFGATKKHCALYPGAQAVADHAAVLTEFSTSKGTIRFQPEQPIPLSVIKAIVEKRMAENKEHAKKRVL